MEGGRNGVGLEGVREDGRRRVWEGGREELRGSCGGALHPVQMKALFVVFPPPHPSEMAAGSARPQTATSNVRLDGDVCAFLDFLNMKQGVV